MEIRPITFRAACDFVEKYHRHHKPSVGCKFSVALYDNENLVGVAICGRPVTELPEVHTGLVFVTEDRLFPTK